MRVPKSKKHDQTRSPERDLGQLFMEIVPEAMREFREHVRRARGSNLSLPQFRILAILWRSGETNNKSLAEHYGISVASTSRMVDALVQMGFVARQVASSDRRQVNLSLTPLGAQEFASIRKKGAAELDQVFQKMANKERAQLIEGLESLRRCVQILADPEGGSVDANLQTDAPERGSRSKPQKKAGLRKPHADENRWTSPTRSS